MKKDKTCTETYTHKVFGLSLQALIILSQNENTCPSCEIATLLQSEATQLRRVLSRLVRENILETREGRDGGYRLKRPANTITLADVYLALQVSEPMCTGMPDATRCHPLGLTMNLVFGEIKEEIDNKVLDVLKQHTIADLAARIHQLYKTS